MKKYQLGALTVSDKGLQDTKEEIVIELIDRMQKYVAEGKAAYCPHEKFRNNPEWWLNLKA